MIWTSVRMAYRTGEVVFGVAATLKRVGWGGGGGVGEGGGGGGGWGGGGAGRWGLTELESSFWVAERLG